MLHDAITQTTALYLPMISFESSDKERQEAIDPLVSEGEAKSLQELCVEKIRGAKQKRRITVTPLVSIYPPILDQMGVSGRSFHVVRHNFRF